MTAERNDNADGTVKKQVLVNDAGRQGGINVVVVVNSNVVKQSRGE